MIKVKAKFEGLSKKNIVEKNINGQPIQGKRIVKFIILNQLGTSLGLKQVSRNCLIDILI